MSMMMVKNKFKKLSRSSIRCVIFKFSIKGKSWNNYFYSQKLNIMFGHNI